MVECQLPKLDVAGSIPVARSKFQVVTFYLPRLHVGLRWPSKNVGEVSRNFHPLPV
jgi:hypothetical protein